MYRRQFPSSIKRSMKSKRSWSSKCRRQSSTQTRCSRKKSSTIWMYRTLRRTWTPWLLLASVKEEQGTTTQSLRYCMMRQLELMESLPRSSLQRSSQRHISSNNGTSIQATHQVPSTLACSKNKCTSSRALEAPHQVGSNQCWDQHATRIKGKKKSKSDPTRSTSSAHQIPAQWVRLLLQTNWLNGFQFSPKV